MNKKVMLIIDVAVAVILLAVDQLTKFLAIQRLKDKPAYVLIDGVLELDYLENRGSAFGMFQNQRGFILTLGLLFVILLLFLLFKLPDRKKYNLLHICITGVIAGGIGNMLDRLRFEYVVDFISFILINYPIFNVADIYVVVSTVGLFILFLFVYKDEDLEFLNFRRRSRQEKK